METKVCRVPSGGCGHGAYETVLKKWPRSALEPEDLKPIPKCSLYLTLTAGMDVTRHFGWRAAGPPPLARVT